MSTPGIAYQIVRNNPLGDHGNIGLPSLGLRLPSLARGSVRSITFNVSRNVSVVSLDFIHRTTSVLTLGTLLTRGKNASVSILTGVRGPRTVHGLSRVLSMISTVVITQNSLKMRVQTRQIPLLRGQVVHRYGRHGVPIVATARVLRDVVCGPHPAHTRTDSITGTVVSNASTIVLSKRSTIKSFPIRTIRVLTHVTHSIRRRLRFVGAPTSGDSRARTLDRTLGIVSSALGLGTVIYFARANCATGVTSNRQPHTPIMTFAPGRGICRRVGLV